MPTFHYTAIEAATGRELSGAVEGATAVQATATLKARGLAPTALAAAGRPKGVKGKREAVRAGKRAARPRWSGVVVIGRAVSAQGLALFTRQLATLLRSGMPLLRSLEVLARQEKRAAFRGAIERIAETIRAGGNFSDALQREPRIFGRLYLGMAQAGEAAGALEAVLTRLADFLEKAERTKGKVKAAIAYPAIVLLLAVGIVAALMVVVVPKFEQIFTGMLKGQPLPALTRGVLEFSAFVQLHALWLVGGAAGVVAGFALVRKTAPGERSVDRMALRAPVIGGVWLKTAVARFGRTFGTLLASGVPMLDALSIARNTSGNRYVADAIATVHDDVREGESVATSLAATGVFPDMLTSMVEVGEETGALPEMLNRTADIYDEEVDRETAALTSLLEPLLIVFLAAVVGTIVIALFLPIVSIIEHLQ